MEPVVESLAGQVAAVRAFNRFYTAKIGLLRKRYLESEYSLTEARMLFEIARQPGLTATELRRGLGLDRGYISRLLSAMVGKGLVREAKSARDGREKLLRLSAAGVRIARALDKAAEDEIAAMLGPLDEEARTALVEALGGAQKLLTEPKPIRIVRATREHAGDLVALLEEYFAELNVVKRDSPRDVVRMLKEERFGFWMAYAGSEAAGCVALRPLPRQEDAGECKRMYVRPQFRGRGLAGRMLDALEEHAVGQRIGWVYLDSFGDLKAALGLYRKRGYKPCERYNTNPQATIFLRKRLGQGVTARAGTIGY